MRACNKHNVIVHLVWMLIAIVIVNLYSRFWCEWTMDWTKSVMSEHHLQSTLKIASLNPIGRRWKQTSLLLHSSFQRNTKQETSTWSTSQSVVCLRTLLTNNAWPLSSRSTILSLFELTMSSTPPFTIRRAWYQNRRQPSGGDVSC